MKDVVSLTTEGPLELKITGSATSFNRRGRCTHRLRRWLNIPELPVAATRAGVHGPHARSHPGGRQAPLLTQNPAW